MYDKFQFSQTIPKTNNANPYVSRLPQAQPIVIKDEQDEDDLDDLFKIGHQSIIQKSVSKSRSQGKKQKKIKKEKKKKEKHKQKKHKKDKKHREKSQSFSDNDSTPILNTNIANFRNERIRQEQINKRDRILIKYQKQLQAYHTQNSETVLNQQFALKQQLSPNSLPIDIIKFGMQQIEKYGLQDRDIPFYKRHHLLKEIIGLKRKKRKMMKLMKQLNLITNQIGVNWERYENTSSQRYFHYEGYEKINGERPLKYVYKNEDEDIDDHKPKHKNSHGSLTLWKQKVYSKPQIRFNHPQDLKIKLPSFEEKLRVVNKQYNIALNSNPKSVDLWLKFLDIQDKLSQLTYANSQIQNVAQQKNAQLQRKISIAQKAFQKNPLDQSIGLKYLLLLCEGKKDRYYVQQTTKKLLSVHPDSQELWRFLLQFKLSNIVDYKHSRLQKQFQEINQYLFQNKIKEVKSGKQAWRIRKCGLLMLEQVLKVHKLEGYEELCTAICCALLQFNLFCGSQAMDLDRQQRLKQFQIYWQDYNTYRLGQYFDCQVEKKQKIQYCWESYRNRQKKEFQVGKQYIQNYFLNPDGKAELTRWLPCHTFHHQYELQYSPSSFILFQDISIYLQTYRNQQNISLLCNILLKNLNMPPMFSGQNIKSNSEPTYLLEWIKNTGNSNLNSLGKNNPYSEHCFLPWLDFWHPELSLQFIGIKGDNVNQVNKFIYCVNLVCCLEIKNQFFQGNELRQYLLFLYGTIYYLHNCAFTQLNRRQIDNLNHLLRIFNKQKCLSKIQSLLTASSQNIKAWAIYIEYEMMSGKKIDECVSCYLSYIQIYLRPEQIQDSSIDLSMVKLQFLYWLSEFLYRWGYLLKEHRQKFKYSKVDHRTIVQTLLKKLLLDNVGQVPSNLFELSDDLSDLTSMQKMLLGNQLMNILKTVNKLKERKQKELCIIYYFLLQIGQSPHTIIPILLKMKTQFSVHVLVDFKFLDFSHFQQSNLVTDHVTNLKLLTYFLRSFLAESRGGILGFYQKWFKPCCTTIKKKIQKNFTTEQSFQEDFSVYEKDSNKKLFLWLLLLRLLKFEHFSTINEIQIQQYFYSIAENKLVNIHEPKCVEILNILMNNPKFSFHCINTFSYCRQIYEIAKIDASNYQKVCRIEIEKQIRVKQKGGK